MEYLQEQLSFLATVYSSSQYLETVGIFLIAIACLVGLYVLLRKPLNGELGMGNEDFKRPSVQFNRKDKKLIVELLEDVIEGRVLFKKLKREKARELYKKIGLALDIPDLIPPVELKALIKARRKHLNGRNNPVPIPGDPPLQNILKGAANKKDKFATFFTKPAP